jgi:hypothetical protein
MAISEDFPGLSRVSSRPRPLPWLAVGYAEVRLLSGDVFVVEGALDEVETKLSDAARSGQSRLAWFKEYGTDDPVGINPAHVASLKLSETSA